MVVNGTRVNASKKQLLRMHVIQSRFFGDPVISDVKARQVSAHELYRLNQRQFYRQTRAKQHAFATYIRTFGRVTWRARMRYRLQQVWKTVAGWFGVGK